MKIYTTKTENMPSSRKFVADGMILTKDMPTAAGSKMLDGYMSLFDAEVITRLKNAGYTLCGKTDVGEFAIDLLGETSYNGTLLSSGNLANASAEAVKSGEVDAAVTLDVNGSVRRAAAQNDLISIKPTYGTVSRYGTVPVACSGETVSVLASSVESCKEYLSVISGHDDKDGTSLSEELIGSICKDAANKACRIAILNSMTKGINGEVSSKLDGAANAFRADGIEVEIIDDDIIHRAHNAWNILMSAELCNNVSRYDGVKYGYRAEKFSNIDELYTNSRTEAFGMLLKSAILFGSDTLSTDNYFKVYDKALRVRRVVSEAFAKLFEKYDIIIMPACSSLSYSEEILSDSYAAYTENFYTAPASITGLPVVVAGGVQLVGKAFSEPMLLDAAKSVEKEGK